MAKNKRQKKVWYITDFRAIFELPDDWRKGRPGPLTYTKSPVMLTPKSKEPDIKLWERLQELKSRPERHMLRSVFEDLKSWAGLKTIKERGYLITTAGQPASYEYVAAQLKMDVDELKQTMPLLEEIGLIEKVTIKKKTPKKSPDTSGRVRTKTDKAGTKRKSFKKPNKKKPNENLNGNGKDNTKRAIKRQDKEKPQEKAPTPTTQPFQPQLSAKGESVIKFPAPSLLNPPQKTQLLGDITKNILHRYNPHAKRFALEIYQALELPWDPTSEQGKRELGCFASAWHKVDIPDGDELWARAVAEARKIAKRKQNRKRGAVWCTVFKNLEVACKKRIG